MAIDPVTKNYITPVTKKAEPQVVPPKTAAPQSTPKTTPAATFERTSSGAIHKIAKNDKEIAENIAAIKAYSANSAKTGKLQQPSVQPAENAKYSNQNPVNKQEIMDAAASLLKSVKNNTNAAFQKAELPKVVTKITDPVKEATDIVGVN